MECLVGDSKDDLVAGNLRYLDVLDLAILAGVEYVLQGVDGLQPCLLAELEARVEELAVLSPQ